MSVFDTKTMEVVEEIPGPDEVDWDSWPIAVDPPRDWLYLRSQESILVVARK